MDDTENPPNWTAGPPNAPSFRRSAASRTDTLVRETWRHYYVARLAEAQFGPDSLEASVAQSRALTSYRALRGSLRDIDPYYRPAASPARPGAPAGRHLRLVRDETPEEGASGQG